MRIVASIFLVLLGSFSLAYPMIDSSLVERDPKSNLPCVANKEGYGVGTDGLPLTSRNLMRLGKPCRDH